MSVQILSRSMLIGYPVCGPSPKNRYGAASVPPAQQDIDSPQLKTVNSLIYATGCQFDPQTVEKVELKSAPQTGVSSTGENITLISAPKLRCISQSPPLSKVRSVPYRLLPHAGRGVGCGMGRVDRAGG